MPITTMLCLLLAGAPEKQDAGTAASSIGTRVMAPWGRQAKRYSGQVAEQYGRYVRVKFDDGDEGWTQSDMTTPTVAAAADPTEKEAFTVGQKVTATWGRKGPKPAVVLETYGKLTLVVFESDDRAWLMPKNVRTR